MGNHTSHLDAPCLLASLPLRRLHRTFPAAAADYFFSSLPRSAFSAVFINALPFDREVKGAESLTVCGRLLEDPGNAADHTKLTKLSADHQAAAEARDALYDEWQHLESIQATWQDWKDGQKK